HAAGIQRVRPGGRAVPALRASHRAHRRGRARHVPLPALSARTVIIEYMTTLSVQAVGRWFGDRELLHDVSFRIAEGDRIGLVGPNGTGKTTLLRIAAGMDEPDSGAVAYARGTRIGFLQQELLGDATGTVEEHARGAAA